MFLFLFIAQTIATVCPFDDKIEKYSFTTKPPLENEWTYENLGPLIANECKGSMGTQRDIKASTEGLSGLKVNLEYMDFDLVTVESASTYPFARYVTNNMKLHVQTETNVQVLYTSKYFQYSPPEHNLDIWTTLPTAEIQIYFEQDQLFSTCDTEPQYAILSIPVFAVDNYFYGPVMNTVETTLKDFNFFKNVTSTIQSDTVSYVSYKGPLNVPPCSDTQWFVLTQTMLMDKTNLVALLARNQVQTITFRELSKPSLSKGVKYFPKEQVFFYYRDDILLNYDDTVEWVATWVAAIAPCLFFAIVGCVYGVWKLSNIGRYKRPEEKEEEAAQIVDHFEEEKLNS